MKLLRTIIFTGGPLDGKAHDLADPFDMGIEPAEIGMPIHPPAATPRAIYKRDDDGVYRYLRTEETNS